MFLQSTRSEPRRPCTIPTGHSLLYLTVITKPNEKTIFIISYLDQLKEVFLWIVYNVQPPYGYYVPPKTGHFWPPPPPYNRSKRSSIGNQVEPKMQGNHPAIVANFSVHVISWIGCYLCILIASIYFQSHSVAHKQYTNQYCYYQCGISSPQCTYCSCKCKQNNW